jgi:hypothetical protein
MAWPLTDDGQFYIFEGLIYMPVDPTSGAAILQLRPLGGMGVGIPAIERGDDGLPANIDTTINFTPIAPGDPTADYAYWTQVSPGSGSTPPLYRMNLGLHTGEDGADGTTTLTLAGVGGTSAPKKTVVVNNAGTGFIYQSQKVGELLIPASISNTASGLGNNTIGTVSWVANRFDTDVRVEPIGHTVVTGTGTDVRVDLLARLNGETGGNIIGRCHGIASTERLHLSGVPPAGSADTFNKVLANQAATVSFRVEQQAGANSFTTSASTTLLGVRLTPIL